MLFSMFGLHPETHEERCQHNKNVCLQDRYKQLQHHDSDAEYDRQRSDNDRAKEQHEPDQREQDDVSAIHIGEQTHTESEWLREETQDLHGNHDRPD